MHPASQYVHDALTRGMEILKIQDEGERRSQMCSLLDKSFDRNYISSVWLGSYAQVDRDATAIQRFPKMISSILIMKVFGGMKGQGGGLDGSFVVHDNPVLMQDGSLNVTVTATSNGGNSYDGNILLKADGAGFKAFDIQYMGFSAVDYQGQEFQDFMEFEYNKDVNSSMPVSALIAEIESDENYVSCP